MVSTLPPLHTVEEEIFMKTYQITEAGKAGFVKNRAELKVDAARLRKNCGSARFYDW